MNIIDKQKKALVNEAVQLNEILNCVTPIKRFVSILDVVKIYVMAHLL